MISDDDIAMGNDYIPKGYTAKKNEKHINIEDTHGNMQGYGHSRSRGKGRSCGRGRALVLGRGGSGGQGHRQVPGSGRGQSRQQG